MRLAIRACAATVRRYWERVFSEMFKYLKVSLGIAFAVVLSSCVTQPGPTSTASAAKTGRFQKVRTTAYTHSEKGGGRNAIGQRLSSGSVKSAASDWSRYPLGTRFRIVGTGEQFVIDDYGGALVGTNTIDLYKSDRRSVRKWGVRHIDIEITRWGSHENSLKVLEPRKHNGVVRRMVVALQKKAGSAATASAF